MSNFIKLDYTKKTKGIYYNSNYEKDLDLSTNYLNIFRNLSYKFMKKYAQSIHHINFLRDDDGKLTGIYLGMRKNTIKPEHIDIEYLEELKKLHSPDFDKFNESLLVIGKHNQNNLSEEKLK